MMNSEERQEWWLWQMYRLVAEYIHDPTPQQADRLHGFLLEYRLQHDRPEQALSPGIAALTDPATSLKGRRRKSGKGEGEPPSPSGAASGWGQAGVASRSQEKTQSRSERTAIRPLSPPSTIT